MPRHSTRPRSAPPRDVPDVATLRADRRARRDRIVDAAVALMIDVDYADIQVKDVAERAGVALGTLYRYFASKDHLMAEALLAWSGDFPAGAARAGGDTNADRAAAVYTRAARAFERRPRVFGALVQLQASGDPYAATTFRAFAERQTEAFRAALSGLPAETRDDVVSVMSAVLSDGLRSWRNGSLSAADLRRRIRRAADLLLGD